jgi:hypothetical protein
MGSTFVQQRENPFRRAQRRMRTRPQQRTVVVPDSESSSDDEYASSSDPSNVSSGSHKSIVAEVHLSHNHAPGPHPCQVNIDHGVVLNDQLSSSVASSAMAVDPDVSGPTRSDGGRSPIIQSQLPSSSSNGRLQTIENETRNINDNFGPVVVKVNPFDSQELPVATSELLSSLSADSSTSADNPVNNPNLNNAIV